MSSSDHAQKRSALRVAEDARQQTWEHPSFVADLFNGAFRWDLVHPFPEQDPADRDLGDEFMRKVEQVLEEFIDPEEVDRTGEVPDEALLALSEVGALGMRIPPEFGGMGLSLTNYNRVMGFIASYSMSTAAWLSAHQSIGAPEPVLLFGTDRQKSEYLPRLARGGISAFALTERGAGSDPARIKTAATPTLDGKKYFLKGEKLWVTNAPQAELLVVLAKTPPADPDAAGTPQLTAFIVEADSPGIEVMQQSSFIGLRGIANGLVRFNNVEVPAENMLGKRGDGLRITLAALNTGRLTLPAAAAAHGKLAMHYAHDWCRARVQWEAPIGRHQMVGQKLALMAAETFAMDSMHALVCTLADGGHNDIRLESAMTKYYCSEAAWRLCDDFVQVRGGRGLETAESLAQRGEKAIPAERMLRDVRSLRIVEGTSEILTLYIAREAMDGHLKRLRQQDAEESGRFWKTISHYSKWYPSQWIPPKPPEVTHLSEQNREHLAYIARAAQDLSRTLFHTLAQRRATMEREQLLLKAFVDIGTDLFAMTAVLSRAEHLLRNDPRDRRRLQQLTHFFCATARDRISANFTRVRHHDGTLVNEVARSFLDGDYQWLVEDVYRDYASVSLSTGRAEERESLESKQWETPVPVDDELLVEEAPLADGEPIDDTAESGGDEPNAIDDKSSPEDSPAEAEEEAPANERL